MTSVPSAMHRQERKTLGTSTPKHSRLLTQPNVTGHWQIWRKRKKLGKKQKSERLELCYNTSWLKLSVRGLLHSLKSKRKWFLVYREKGKHSLITLHSQTHLIIHKVQTEAIRNMIMVVWTSDHN